MIAVIDITGNNLASLANAIKGLGYDYCLTHDPKVIEQSSHVILSGVGVADVAMAALKQHDLIQTIKQLTQPILGICLGMQLLAEYSEEGDTACLNLIPGTVKALKPAQQQPVPHVGWNRLQWLRQSPLSRDLNEHDYVYFVHGYALFAEENALARCAYSQEFTAIVQHKNSYGMQFHPEKSAKTGLKLLNNFFQLGEKDANYSSN